MTASIVGWIISPYGKVSIPFGIQRELVTMSAMFFGILLHKTNAIKRQYSNKSLVVSVISSLIILILISQYVRIETVGAVFDNFGVYQFSFIIGTVLLISTAKLLTQFKICEKVCTWFAFCGRNSLYILCLHFISFKLVTLVFVVLSDKLNNLSDFPTLTGAPQWAWIVYSIIGVIMPCCFVITKKKIISR